MSYNEVFKLEPHAEPYRACGSVRRRRWWRRDEHREQKKDEPMDHVSGFRGFVVFEARYTIWNRIATRAMSLTLLLRRKRSGSELCILNRNRTVSCSGAVGHCHKGHDIRGISWPAECLRRGLFPIMLEQTEAAHDRVERSRCRGNRDRSASGEDFVPRGAGCHTSRRCGGWDRRELSTQHRGCADCLSNATRPH